MKNTSLPKFLSLFLCLTLVAALALTGCGKAEAPAETTAAAAEAVASTTADGAILIGEGATAFNFVYQDLDGKETRYEVHTDAKTVGEALLANKLVEGTVGEWGLMVDTVGGLKLDFEKDGMYWGFFIDGEYAQTGVDSTDIAAGATYSMVPSK